MQNINNLVVGGTNGIGLALVKKMCEDNRNIVYVVGRNPRRIKSYISSGQVVFIYADLSGDVKETAKHICDEIGRPLHNVLFTAAEIGPLGEYIGADYDAKHDKAKNVNCYSQIEILKTLERYLRVSRETRVLFIASEFSDPLVYSPMIPSYCHTKLLLDRQVNILMLLASRDMFSCKIRFFNSGFVDTQLSYIIDLALRIKDVRKEVPSTVAAAIIHAFNEMPAEDFLKNKLSTSEYKRNTLYPQGLGLFKEYLSRESDTILAIRR